MSLILGIILLFVLSWLTWHSTRQTRLNQSLMTAIGRNDVVTAQKLLREGADPNSREHINSPIDRFIDWIKGYEPGEQEDTTVLVKAAAEGHTDIVRLLIQYGANVNIRCRYQAPSLLRTDPNNYSALELAKFGHHSDIVRLLQQAGAK